MRSRPSIVDGVDLDVSDHKIATILHHIILKVRFYGIEDPQSVIQRVKFSLVRLWGSRVYLSKPTVLGNIIVLDNRNGNRHDTMEKETDTISSSITLGSAYLCFMF